MAVDGSRARSSRAGRLVVFVVLYAFWLLFSGQYDFFHLSLGFICSLLVTYVSHDLLTQDIAGVGSLGKIWRFVQYVPWLIYQVIVANLHVAYLVINPKAIDPQVVGFKTKLKSDISLVTLANSITLTPGTITMDIVDGHFYVHALSQKVADDLLTGEMERRVARIYLEDEDV